MPKPHRRQASWPPRVSVPPSVALPPPPTAQCRCLLRACRRVAQALEHEGKGGTTGKQVIADP